MIRFAVLALALAGSAAAAQSPMQRALEACGGTEIRLSAPEGTTAEQLAEADRVLNKRLGGGFLTDFVAVEEGGLTVRLPASSVNLDAFADALVRVDLGFHAVSDPGTGREVTDAEGRSIWIDPAPVLDGGNIADAQPVFDQNGQPALSFRFDAEGARLFGEFTAAHIGQPFAILLDGELLSAPVIREPIHGGQGQISGSFTVDEVTRLALLLRDGQLPIDLSVESADEVPGNPEADQSLCPSL